MGDRQTASNSGELPNLAAGLTIWPQGSAERTLHLGLADSAHLSGNGVPTEEEEEVRWTWPNVRWGSDGADRDVNPDRTSINSAGLVSPLTNATNANSAEEARTCCGCAARGGSELNTWTKVSRWWRWLGFTLLVLSPVYGLAVDSLRCLGYCDKSDCISDKGIGYAHTKHYFAHNITPSSVNECCDLCETTTSEKWNETCRFFTYNASLGAPDNYHGCSLFSNLTNSTVRYEDDHLTSGAPRPRSIAFGERMWRIMLSVFQSSFSSGLTILLWVTFFGDIEYHVARTPIDRVDGGGEEELIGRVGALLDTLIVTVTATSSELSTLWKKVPTHAVAISCACFIDQVIQHSLYQEYGQRQNSALLRKVNSTHVFKSTLFGFPSENSAHPTTDMWFYYLQYFDLFLTAAKYLMFISGVDAVCGRFMNLREDLDCANRAQDTLNLRRSVSEVEHVESSLASAQGVIVKATYYHKNVLFSAILGQAFVVIVSASLYVHDKVVNKFWVSIDEGANVEQESDDDVRDSWDLYDCRTWNSEWDDDVRCVLVWGIFVTDLIAWVLLLVPCVYAIWVATRFNRAMRDFITTRARKISRDQRDVTSYLAGLDQLGMLFIAPFGFKLTDANIVQAGVFSVVSLGIARVVTAILSTSLH